MLVRRLLILFAILIPIIGSTAGKAQNSSTLPAENHLSSLLWPEYSVFQSPVTQSDDAANTLTLRLNSTGYFKNNEYKNSFVTGSTITGIFFDPVLEYYPDNKIAIRAGAHLLKFHGENAFERVVPVFSIQYSPDEHLSVIFGTISGTVNHGLIEPVQDFEKYLTDNYENGLQLLLDYKHFKSDNWLNWEQFLKAGDPFQERFTVGSNSSILILNKTRLKLSVPLSGLLQHKGGEIDSTTLPASTRLNLVEGVRISLDNPGNGNPVIRSVGVLQNFIQFLEINPCDAVTIPYGQGSYSRIFLDTKFGSLEAGYWKAKNFIAPAGMPVFQSVSQKNPLYLESGREMLVIKYQYEHQLTSYLKIVGRIEPYYHFSTGRLDHSWGIYLIFNDEVLVARTIRR